jgi:hypothetical protein
MLPGRRFDIASLLRGAYAGRARESRTYQDSLWQRPSEGAVHPWETAMLALIATQHLVEVKCFGRKIGETLENPYRDY